MWIARDKHGELNLFNVKPIRCPITRNKYWVFPDEVKDPEHMELDSSLFPSLTWDSEPVECFVNTGFDMAKQLNQIWSLVKCLQDENAKLRVSTNCLLEKMQAINKIING